MAALTDGARDVLLEPEVTLCYNENIDQIRHDEYPMLKEIVYLDHASTTLYPKSLIERSSNELTHNLFGNPHSNSSSSQLSTRRIDDVRLRALRFFGASPDDFGLVFVANATAGIKLVAECFREQEGGFWYGYHRDAHTSLIGVREHAAEHRCFGEDEEIEQWLQEESNSGPAPHHTRVRLFAYPAQSNLNGRRLPLSWSSRLRCSNQSRNGRVYSLLDAAALVSTSPLDLSDTSEAPDFTVFSFYKIFGFPDLGALIFRKESSFPLSRRRYFGGGTVEMVTCMTESWHIKKQDNLHEQLEDGTLPVHSIIALNSAFEVFNETFGSLKHVSSHASFLANRLYHHLSSVRHPNGLPVCVVYKDPKSSYTDSSLQGPILALNLRNSKGEWISNTEIEKLAAIRNIHFRSGGLCNPGGVASYLSLAPWEMKRNFSAGQRCGNENDILGGKPTGVIRLSLGATSNIHDITVFVQFIEEFFVEHHHSSEPTSNLLRGTPNFYVETITIFPIKSCGGWQVPPSLRWDIRPEGLAWDREWCLVHQGTRAALSQKRVPRMALLRPTLDLKSGLLRVRYDGPHSPLVLNEITVPLSADPSPFQDPATKGIRTCSSSRVCGDAVSAHIYASSDIAAFFTATLSTPSTLARFPSGSYGRYSKLHLKSQHQSRSSPSAATLSIPGAFPPTPPPSPPPLPILLSNESPILAISRSSLNKLNKLIPTTPALASVFRANLVLAQTKPAPELPYDEDNWSALRLQTRSLVGNDKEETDYIDLDVLGPCRRCQMICIDQKTAEHTEEPFVTLAKTRRKEGEGSKVFFGVHCALATRSAEEGREADDGKSATIGVGDGVMPVKKGEGDED
ncbi:MAG: hypothetical protein Q9170_000018 [Blastenia crenularia]